MLDRYTEAEIAAELAGAMYIEYQTFAVAYYGASGLLILAAVMTLLVKPTHHKLEAHDV